LDHFPFFWGDEICWSSAGSGDFLLMNTAANGLQVFNQNDNGWDQAA
jgi:hypothetical protein